MNKNDIKHALEVVQCTARQVGGFLKKQLHVRKDINHQSAHDIKLELDDRSQRKIERVLLKVFPNIALLGEEGTVGDPTAEWRWSPASFSRR